MSDAASQNEWMTFDEFLDAEARSSERSELIGGFARLMAGASIDHNLVIQSAVASLRPDARAHKCRLTSEGVLLRIDDDAFYPDVMLVCEPRTSDRFETEPCLIIEVLSRTTAETDRNLKRLRYTAIPSLQHYLIVHIDSQTVECYTRLESRWTRRTAEVNEQIRIGCIGADLIVADLFADLGS